MSARFEITYPTISDLQFINSQIRAHYLPAKKAHEICFLKYKSRNLQSHDIDEVIKRVKIVQDCIRSYSSFFYYAKCPYTSEEDVMEWSNEREKRHLFARILQQYSFRVIRLATMPKKTLEPPPAYSYYTDLEEMEDISDDEKEDSLPALKRV